MNQTKSFFIDFYFLAIGLIVGIIFIGIYQIGLPLSLIPLTSIVACVMTFQAGFSLYWMLYSWEDARNFQNRKIADSHKPHHFFSAIIPARHESTVIADTIRAVSSIRYPDNLKETIVVCRADDTKTIAVVQKTIREINTSNLSLVTFYDKPINKPHALNIGLHEARGDVVVVFDAEDQPHPEIYNTINAEMAETDADVIQSGVQLMNVRSSWFSTLNVLEYFFWFKSTLHFFAKVGAVPLAGNTVFFKRYWLKKISGWDETCLTEDADIGIRLSNAGANIAVVYDERTVTREETPPTLSQFVKQRTRWNQGFLQILGKGDWLKFPRTNQKLLAGYVLSLPFLQALFFLFVPISVVMAMTLKLPVIVTLLSLVPLFILFIQLIVQTIGLYEFSKNYGIRFSIAMPFIVFLTFFPYQILLSVSAFRAILRLLVGNFTWEKTLHVNAHRNYKNSQELI